MEIKHFKTEKMSYMTFENIFDNRELELIWQEAIFLCHEDKLLDPNEAGTARDAASNSLKKNKGVWIESVYYNKNISNYLKLYKKGIYSIFRDKDNLIKVDFNLKLFFNTNCDSTLMSYYENQDYYDTHFDNACYTYVFWLFKEPKKFSGGNLSFPEIDQSINVKSNMAVLFPSWTDHKVDKIQMHDTIESYKCNGRFAFTTFFNMQG